jgi:hypothetical protein
MIEKLGLRLLPALLLCTALPAFASSPAPVGIVSDVDDTVRLTGVLEEWNQEWFRRYQNKYVFPGMAELYRQMVASSGASPERDVYFVSGAPLVLERWVSDCLALNGFPTSNLLLRLRFVLVPTLQFKTESFARILSDHPGQRFVFIGDDTEYDADAIASARRRSFPSQVAASYIHALEGKNGAKPTEAQEPWYTAIEIALHEMKQGRLSGAAVDAVAGAMLADPRFDETVVPDYADLCPGDGWLAALVSRLGLSLAPRLGERVSEIESRVAEVCEQGRLRRELNPIVLPEQLEAASPR